MLFFSPLWLFALIPWAGAVLWLLWGRRRKTPVPFLELWRGPALQKPTNRALQPPPVYLALAMLAMFLAVLAAARPAIRTGRPAPRNPLNIIVDRGLSMSARAGTTPRFKVEADLAGRQLASLFADSAPVDLIALPDGQSVAATIGSWATRIAGLTPTAIDTHALLDQLIRARLATEGGPIIVVSDCRLPFDDPRLIQFSPDAPVENIGVVRLAARETPAPQVMARLRNDSGRKTVRLVVTSGSQRSDRVVDLPPTGDERDYFFDLPKLEQTVEAEIEGSDDQPADDRAWLLREGSNPRIEARTALSAELRRFLDVYMRSRPSGEGSTAVAVVGAESDLPAEAPSVWIAPATGPKVSGTIVSAAHPVTQDVDFSGLSAGVQTAGEPPRGWTPLLSVDGQTIVAARAAPARKVWVAFSAPGWTTTPDFVVFWANVLTWTGQGEEQFAAHQLTSALEGWTPVKVATQPFAVSPGTWPGIYRSEGAALRAYNCPAPRQRAAAATTPDWRGRLLADRGLARGARDITPALLILAIGCVLGSAMTWKQRGLTPVSADRTF